MDIWGQIVGFVSVHYEAGMVVGMVLLVVAVIAQFIVNSSLEEEIIDIVERIEELEKKCGIDGCEGISESGDSENFKEV